MTLNTHTGLPWCNRCNYAGCEGGLRHYAFKFRLFRKKKKEKFTRWIRSFTDFDYSKIDDIEIEDIDYRDAPDFCDAFISSATYKGKVMTDSQLERLNEDRDFVYEQVQEKIY